ncbi:hypothetical protein [Shewanella sp. SR43-8]|uniref:hypothetical protein n=1 Tax=Shewanella sp. SR43-8 TaxID=2760938 RepID=UPI00160361BB|nr:hypothetical protein [Shewanella sp. SR43-8]MBB1322126.1 hypothetical protein [Shewanella sp. SR43-8]
MELEEQAESVPVFTDGMAAQTSQQSATETLETSNDELEEFIGRAESQERDNKPEKSDAVDKITVAAARVMVTNGAQGIMYVCGLITRTNVQVTSTEIDLLSEDLAPLIVKYGKDFENMPPWMKAVMKYRIEIIALKGVCLFGVSVVSNIKAQKRAQAKELAEEEKAKKAEAVSYDE